MATEKKEDCFVIMPFGERGSPEKEHFTRVYEDIIKPSIIASGFFPIRADDVESTHLIHLSILEKLVETPMVVCDMSALNPNVFFELGIRQAFDKPVVLIQEEGTPQIFDVNLIKHSEYSKELKYNTVIRDQQKLTAAIKATKEACEKGNVKSLINLMSLKSPATMPQLGSSDKSELALSLMSSDIGDLRSLLNRVLASDDRRENVKEPVVSITDLICNLSNELLRLSRYIEQREGHREERIYNSFLAKCLVVINNRNATSEQKGDVEDIMIKASDMWYKR